MSEVLVHAVDILKRNVKKSPLVTAMAIFCLGMGCAALMSMVAVLHMLARDPLPTRSAQLFYPRLEYATGWQQGNGPDPSNSLSLVDAETLRQFPGQRYASLLSGTTGRIALGGRASSFFASGHGVSADFFPMFGVRFLFGAPWSQESDARGAHQIVLTKLLNDRIFDGQNSVGRTMNLGSKDYQVVGVMDDWDPEPRFYADFGSRAFGHMDVYFVPFRTLLEPGASVANNLSCFGSRSDDPLRSSSCTWVNYWTMFENSSAMGKFERSLWNYAEDQRRAGRLKKGTSVELLPLMDWLDRLELVPRDIKIQARLSFLFYLVCVSCVVGLLLSKFAAQSHEISIRRALGASRRRVFRELLGEALAVGMAGAVVGAVFSQIGVAVIRSGAADYARFVHLNLSLLVGLAGVSLLGCAVAAILPAYLVCRIPPVTFLRAS